MEIYYCQTCGIKIDSDALAAGEGVRHGADQVYCRACAIKAGIKTPTVKFQTHERPSVHAPQRASERVRPRSAAAPSPAASSSATGVIIMVVGVAILGLGAYMALKGGSLPPKPADPEPPPVVVKPPDPVKPKDPPPPPPPADPEKAADAEYAEIKKGEAGRTVDQNAELLENLTKKFPNTFSGRRASVDLSRINKLKQVYIDGVVSVATVEGDEQWGFHPGSEFAGATGSMVKDDEKPKEGKHSIKMTGDFTGGGSYVSSGHTITGPALETLSAIPAENVRGLRVWVRSPVNGIVGLRAVDSSDQCHQQGVRIEPKDEWQPVVFKNLNKGEAYSHWGGKNDGAFYWPLRSFHFLINITGVGPTKKADIWLDQVEVIVEGKK